jgi:hypothetical protein
MVSALTLNLNRTYDLCFNDSVHGLEFVPALKKLSHQELDCYRQLTGPRGNVPAETPSLVLRRALKNE